MKPDELKLLYETFFHDGPNSYEAGRKTQTDFAYYTTAETLIKIIESRSVFMRNTKVLNDVSEVKFGYDYLRYSVDQPEGDELFAALKDIDPILDKEKLFWEYFGGNHYPGIADSTYVLSLSDHSKAKSKDMGLLSMWRAYGGNAGVALIIDGAKTVFVESDALNAWTHPVQYVDCGPNYSFRNDDWLAGEFRKITSKIIEKGKYLRRIDPAPITGHLMHAFNLAVVRTKHAAFREENEWRVIRTQMLTDNVKAGMPTTETIRGIPQKVVKLNLENYKDAEPNPLNLELNNIIKKVLIGPCSQADVIAEAVVERLESAGVVNAHARVTITNIPYRANHP
jgi:hypothetical protein